MSIQRELVDAEGLCRASIRTNAEIATIRSDLARREDRLERTSRWLEAVKDPTRFKALYLLHRHGALCVCDLANVLGVTSSAISQHLRKLKDMALVTAERRKQTIFHAIADADFAAFLDGLTAEDRFEARPAGHLRAARL